jgi:hypothetical protein
MNIHWYIIQRLTRMSTKGMEMDTKVEVMGFIKEEVDNRGGRGQLGRGRGRGHYYCFNCWKEDHISLDFPIKDRTDLKFCNICGVGDHSLEDFRLY